MSNGMVLDVRKNERRNGFHLQGRRVSQARNQYEAGSKQRSACYIGLHGVKSPKIE
jgi:hypothetical protein